MGGVCSLIEWYKCATSLYLTGLFLGVIALGIIIKTPTKQKGYIVPLTDTTVAYINNSDTIYYTLKQYKP